MAHKLDFIIEASEKIKDPSIHFLFVGAGAEKKNLEKLVQKKKVKNATLLGMISKEAVPEYLSILDVSLINLKKSETFKTVIPSKIFESCAMGKPILLGVDGEARRMIESYPAGLYFEPEDENDFLEKLYKIKMDKDLYLNLTRSCKQLAEDYDRVKLARSMAEVLESVII